MFGGNFAPAGWMTCSGQTLPISENETLFQLIGTTYGGDGEETFQLPNLCGRVPIHMGTGPGLSTYQIGQNAGTESVTLTVQQIPQHNHMAMSTTVGGTVAQPGIQSTLADETSTASGGNAFAYQPAGGTQVTLPAQTVGGAGGSQPHENMMPYLCVTFVISLFGVFPTPT
jgi:microcystin-dependent protein